MSPRSIGRGKPKKRPSPPAPPPARRATFTAEEWPELTPRYTPPLVRQRRRPPWHRLTGWLLAAAGVALVLANYAQDFGPRVLPGGHNELYFLLGIVIAGTGSWWLGVFDRPESQRR